MVQSLLEWESILEEIEMAGFFGLNLAATGPDPLSHEIQRISLAVPNIPCSSTVYTVDIADRPELKESIIGDLAGLLEERRIKKILYDSKSVLSFIRARAGRKLNFCSIFDIMLASQICWSGYYYLTPSGNPKNPWAKRLVDHSLASLAERHLGIVLDKEGCSAQGAAALLPLHDILAELLARNDLQRVADLEFSAAIALA
jgi:DNA polymerase I-like protein with 3'-5' exonuclease and polymerase domains